MTDKGTPDVKSSQYTTRTAGEAPDTAGTRMPPGSTANAAPSSSNWGIVIGTVAVVAVVALGAWALLGSNADAPEVMPAAPAVIAPAPEAVTPAPELVTPVPEAVTPAPEAVTPVPEAVVPAPEAGTAAPESGTLAPEAQPAIPEPTAPAPPAN